MQQNYVQWVSMSYCGYGFTKFILTVTLKILALSFCSMCYLFAHLVCVYRVLTLRSPRPQNLLFHDPSHFLPQL